MNLYLVLAIALGAITGVVAAPALRPVQLVTASESRRERRTIRRNLSGVRSRLIRWSGALQRAVRRAEVRRYAIASPRAPASV